MVEFLKGKLLIGPVVALIGSVLLLIGGLRDVANPVLIPLLTVFPTLALTFILPIIFGLLGLCGAVLAATGRKVGNYVTILFGLIATIAMFIPVPTGILFLTFPLSGNLFYLDPILILIGGILGIVIKE